MYKHVIWGNDIEDDEQAIKVLMETSINDKKELLRRVPIMDILRILEETGRILTNPEGIYYQIVLERLPSLLGYATKMVEDGLLMLRELLTVNNLTKRLSALEDYRSLDYPVNVQGKMMYTTPVGCVCHIAAGNIFLGAVDSLVYGLITKNINIVKVSKKCPDFPFMFLQALRLADRQQVIAPMITMMYWHHDHEKIQTYLQEHCDYILLFGGRDAVTFYKSKLSEKNSILAYGPKMSFGLVTKGLSKEALEEAARGFAMDIVMWEQNACTSCQHIFMEIDEDNNYFIEQLNSALEALGHIYENPHMTMDEKMEVRRLRALEAYQAYDHQTSRVVKEGIAGHHTMIIRDSHHIHDTPLTRTIYINRIQDYKELLTGNMKDMGYYLGTMGLACSNGQQQIMDAFIPLGVDRFCLPGKMSLGKEEGSLHEGSYIVSHLTKQISMDGIATRNLGLSEKKQEDKEVILLSKINHLLSKAIDAPYYRELYQDVKLPLLSLEEYKQVPVLTQEPLMNRREEMVTEKPTGAYLFSPGGSSGNIKHVYYSNDEFSKSKEVFGEGFVDVGITEEDVVANYLKAGSLWTAFIACNRALEATGCKILSLTANQPEEVTIEYLSQFRPNVILGIPGCLTLLAQAVEEQGADITFEKIYYSGNHLTEKSRQYLQHVFHCDHIRSFGYAAVETGPIGYQCPHCGPYDYHVFEDWGYVEREDDGSVLVTNLYRTLHPIIRYRLGDLVDIVKEPCPCGKSSQKIRLYSRNDSILRLSTTDLYLWDIEQVMEANSKMSPFYQLEVSVREDLYLDIAIQMEAKEHLEATQELALTLLKEIKGKSKALGDDKDKNLIANTRLKITAPGTIKRNTRGKIQRVIDHRR